MVRGDGAGPQATHELVGRQGSEAFGGPVGEDMKFEAGPDQLLVEVQWGLLRRRQDVPCGLVDRPAFTPRFRCPLFLRQTRQGVSQVGPLAVNQLPCVLGAHVVPFARNIIVCLQPPGTLVSRRSDRWWRQARLFAGRKPTLRLFGFRTGRSSGAPLPSLLRRRSGSPASRRRSVVQKIDTSARFPGPGGARVNRRSSLEGRVCQGESCATRPPPQGGRSPCAAAAWPTGTGRLVGSLLRPGPRGQASRRP